MCTEASVSISSKVQLAQDLFSIFFFFKTEISTINTVIQVMNQRHHFCLLELCNPCNRKSVIITKLP